MSSAITSAGILFVILICGAVFLFIARWMLRLALKVALGFALIFILVAGGVAMWWQRWFASSSSQTRRPPVQTNQRTNANRRAPAR